MKIFGLDISLDHGGVVCLNEDGSVFDYFYLTTTKKMSEVDPDHSFLLSKKGKDESKDTFRLRRMDEFANIPMFLTADAPSSYFSVEGYAYASKTTSICQIAELTGYLKHLLFVGGGHLRIHDPLTVKLFAVGTGNCMKKDIVDKALTEFDIPKGLIKKKQIKKKGCNSKIEEYDGPATDLADAYFLAQMLYVELKVRKGELYLEHLNEWERRIFLRVTKAYPINLLARSFICKEEDKNV